MATAFDETPTYNLKAVVQETGLKPDTVRAWERRYGLPQPGRTPGGHRLYSQRDIYIIKWLIARQQEGMSISRAVRLWQQYKDEGQDPFIALPVSGPTAKSTARVVSGDRIDEMKQVWIQACSRFDEAEAESTLAQAAAEFPLETVVDRILAPALAQIGEEWHSNHLSVQQEHFASALAERRLHAFLASTPPPIRQQPIIVGCPQGEFHTFSALALTLLLRRRGWPVIYLGANVPVAHFEQTVGRCKAQLVVLSAQRLSTTAVLNDISRLLPEQHAVLAFGGGAFVRTPDLYKRIGGIYLGDDFQSSMETLESWLTHPVPSPTPPAISPGNAVALKAFRDHWPAILSELRMTPGLPELADSPNGADTVFSYLAYDIIAALQLNDINLAATNLPWLLQLLRHRNIPLQALADLLQAMQQAASRHIDHTTTLISDWLQRLWMQYTPRQGA